MSSSAVDLTKRVAVVAPFANPHVLSIFDALQESSDWQVDVFVFRDLPDHRKQLGWESCINVKRITQSPGSIVSTVRLLLRYQHVVFYGLFDPVPGQTLLAMTVAFRGANVWVLSEGFKAKGRRLPLPVRAALNRPSVRVLAVGHGSDVDFRSGGLTKPDYYRFCFCEEYDLQSETNLQSSTHGKIRILAVGQLISRKNFGAILECLRDQKPTREVEVIVCGEGPERRTLLQLADQLPCNVSLCLRGNCDKEQLANEFYQADIFVMPSIYDGWGVVLNQAVEFGVPVLVSDGVRAATDHLVVPGCNGFIYSRPSEMSRYLDRMINDEQLRRQLAAGSLEVASLWNRNTVAERLNHTFQEDNGYESGPLQKI